MFDKIRYILIFQKSTQFLIELFNNIMIGETWSWLQVASASLSVMWVLFSMIKPESINGNNFRCVMIMNFYYLAAVLVIMCYIFSAKDNRP